MELNPMALLRGRSEKRNAIDNLANAFFYGGSISASGVRVTPETALASVAVAACIEVRAETFSSLPGGVFEKQDRKRLPVDEHPVSRLLFDKPNDLMTGGELQRWTTIRKDLTGNAYWRVVYRNGRPSEIWPLYGTNPEIRTKDGKVAYRYQGDELNPAGTYSSNDIIHFKGPFLKNPLEAASPIDLIKDTIGLSIATEQFFGRFLNNGTHFPTYLETDSVLTSDDVKAIAASLATTQGVLGAGKTRIFDRGIKVKQNPMSLKDADLSGQMRWYLEQICRIYRVPLPLVQDWTHGTYTNSEQAGLWFAQHTITPIAVDYERTTRKLFTVGEDKLYVRFNVDAILRGDYATRTAGYNTLISAGVINRNEARAFENLDPYDGGDEYLVPLNMTTSTAITPTDGTQPTRSIPETLSPIIEDAIARIKIRAQQDHERGRDLETTRTWALENVMPPIIRAITLGNLNIDPKALVNEALSEHRAVEDIKVPQYVQDNAQRGLDYYKDGKGGDGLVDQTIRDARDLAAGNVSPTKVAKIGPWIDRHLVDLQAPKNSNPDDPEYPGPGLVAMLLWGGGPDRDGAIRTRDWAYGEVEKIQSAD
jgi:HK97 family phage portal protein